MLVCVVEQENLGTEFLHRAPCRFDAALGHDHHDACEFPCYLDGLISAFRRVHENTPAIGYHHHTTRRSAVPPAENGDLLPAIRQVGDEVFHDGGLPGPAGSQVSDRNDGYRNLLRF